jgi:hypothetical protein
MVQLTAIYVGGPNDGETEEITVAPEDVLGPGEIRLQGFEIWPVESGSPGPIGRYEPGPAGKDVGTIQFVWQDYTQEQRSRRLNDPDHPFRVTQLTGLSQLINRAFFGTPISAWIVRRALRRQPVQPKAQDRVEPDKPDSDTRTGPGSE